MFVSILRCEVFVLFFRCEVFVFILQMRDVRLLFHSKLPSAMPVRAAPSFSEFANAHTAFKIQNCGSAGGRRPEDGGRSALRVVMDYRR